MANRRCLTRQQRESAQYELQLLKEPRIRYESSPLRDSIATAIAPLLDSFTDAVVRKKLYDQQAQLVKQLKDDMFSLHVNSAKAEVQYYDQRDEDEIKKMWQDQRSLTSNQRLTPAMLDLIEQRAKILEERVLCIHNFRTKAFAD